MKPKQAVSLLLAAQILGAPLAQAAPLSSRSAAALNGQNVPPAFQHLRVSSAAEGAGETSAAPGRLVTQITETTAAPTSEVTPTATPEATAAPTPEVTPTATPEVTATPTPEVTPSVPPETTVTPTPEVTPTATPEATAAPTPEVTSTATPEVTATPTPEATPTATPEVTATPTPEVTPTATPEVTATPTPEVTPSVPPETTVTPTPQVTPTATPEVTVTPTPEVTPTPTPEAVPPAVNGLPGDMLQINALGQELEPLAEPQLPESYSRLYLGFGYEAIKADVVGNNGQIYSEDTHPGKGGSLGEIAVEKEADPADWRNGPNKINSPFLKYGGRIYDGFERGMIVSDEWAPQGDGYHLEDLPVVEYHSDDEVIFTLTEEYTREMLGRVPDYEFDSWYVYGFSSYSRRGIIWRTLFHDSTEHGTLGVMHDDIQSVDKVPILPSNGDTAIPYGVPVDIDALKATIPADQDAKREPISEYNPQGYYDTQDAEDGGELPLLAYWKLSSKAELVDEAALNPEFDSTKATTQTALYTVTSDGQTTTNNILKQGMWKSADMTGTPTTFDYTKDGEYWLGVSSLTTGIVPDLIAYEAYRSAEISGTTGITIRAKAVGDTGWTDYTVQHSVLNDSAPLVDSNGDPIEGRIDEIGYPLYRLKNSTTYPMRSEWTLKDKNVIPLKETTSASPFNDIEVTLTSPDGEVTRKYTFHIRRLGDPRAELNPGNTPYGMIARDTSATWGSTEEERAATKAQTKADFVANGYSFKGLRYVPWDAANNNGNYAYGDANRSLSYSPSAWLLPDGYDPDLDETAIVVYQDSSFVDPGLAVYDTLGNKVDITGGSVSRSVVLRLADDEATGALTTQDLYTWEDRGQYYYKGLHDMPKVEENVDTFQVVTDPDGKSRIDLRGQKVIPGVYTMEYAFTDPWSGEVYSSTSGNYVDPSRADNFRRTLVVLSVPGDVDMDGAVTPADGEVLRRAFGSGQYDDKFLNDIGTDPTVALFAYRVCDVDNNGTVDVNGDAGAIRLGYSPEYNDVRCDYFYLPLPDGMTDAEREEWHKRVDLQIADPDAPDDPDDKRGKLSLEYLGVHEDTVVDAAALDTFQAGSDKTEGVSVGDIFWVGVRISDIGELVRDSLATEDRKEKKAIAGGLAAVSMSIAYDSRYVKPAVLKDSWEETLEDYNIALPGQASPTTWPSYYVITPGSRSSNAYTVHYSRPVSPLEKTEGAELKELTVALNRREGSTDARVLDRDDGKDEYYLLRIPFEVERVPKDATTLDALEMCLGMRGIALFSQLVPQQELDVPQVSVCWSAQHIFGDNTRNLSDELIYMDGSARSIPLGEDTTPATDLVNRAEGSNGKTVYGQEYVNRELDAFFDESDLPAGLTKDSSGHITGYPTEVGTFILEHEETGKRYRITVEKAPLTLTATPQERYYGEPNGELVYTYDVNQIKAPDLPNGANYVAGFVNDGSMAMLEKLPGFRAPERTTTVTQDTGAGDYAIHITDGEAQPGDTNPLTNYGSGTTNYRFVYRNGDGSGTPSTEADSLLKVKPRPLLVQKVPQSGVSVFVTDPTKIFEDRQAVYENSGSQEYSLVDLTSQPEYAGKLTGTPVYSTDRVELTFTVELKDADRNPNSPWYTIPAGDASLAVGAYIYDLAISDGAENYTLINRRTNGSVMPQDNEAEATAIASRVVGIQVKNPPSLDYDYGSTFRVYGLQVVLSRSDGRDSEYNYINDASESNYAAQGIQFTWEEDKTSIHRDDPSHKLTNGLILDYDTHNGRYFCVSVPGYDDDGNATVFTWYSENPMVVRKAPLTITVSAKTVYYGEYGTAGDPPLTFTYNVGELTLEDQNDLLALFPDRTSLRGTQEELEKLVGYHAPLMEAWTGTYGTTEKIDENTSVGRYSIWIYNDVDGNNRILSGAKNYSFYYTRGVDRDPNMGMGTLQIQRRPIVVNQVVLGADSRAFVYDDTRELKLNRMYYKDSQGNMVPQSLTLSGVNGSAGADMFVATIPTSYIGTNNAAVTPPYLLSGDAIHTNTETNTLDTVVLTYRATYIPDPGKEQAVPPASTYFDLPAGQSTKLADVKIDQLALSEEGESDNSNYILVYARNTTLATQRPEDDSAQGKVELRPIEELTVSAPPTRLSYTYGDQIDLSGMTLEMRYGAEGDNAYDLNKAGVIERSLSNIRVGESDSFGLQGLKAYWIDTGEDWTGLTQAQLAQKAQTLSSANRGSYPDVSRTGKKLVVLGRRVDSQQWVWGMMEDGDTYTIAKKVLPLRVGNLNRFYGEHNATAQRPYTANFFVSDLAQPDRDKLADAGLLVGENQGSLTAAGADLSLSDTAVEVSTKAVSPVLSLLNADYEGEGTTKYIGPRFTTTGTQGSNVGRYEISLDLQESQMANYTFTQTGTGTLRLFRRPIEIGKVLQDPVMTIYVNTPATVYPAYAESSWTDTDGTRKQGFTVQLPHLQSDGTYESRDPEVIDAANSGIAFNMPLTGDGLWGDDVLGLNMSVTYPVVGNRNPLPESAKEVSQPVTVSRLSLSGETARNYYLANTSTPIDRNATGALDRRSIKEIKRIITPPTMSYTYGEALDLSDLAVEVVFDRITVGDQPEPETTVTLRANDLLGRLAVNYWDSPILPGDREAGLAQRPAQSGDHLTIAPVHDGSGFAHDGKYLILTARAHASTEPAAPVLVYTNLATQQPAPLTVAPLDLQYELTAQGKIYDGTTATQGTITLTNPYVDQRQEEPGETPDRDLIYVVTGDETLSDSDLAQAVNDPGKTLGEVYHYESGTEGLTFRFFDPNVVYYEGEYTPETPVAPADWQGYWDALAPRPETPGDPDWDGYEALEVAPMPVLVSGLTLAGPDAANYRLDPQVDLADNADPAAGKDPVPYAVMEKAQREIAWTEEPRVSVDHHTNTVRVSYDTPLEELLTQVLPDRYHSELHYEYALEYQPEGESDPVLDPDTGLALWGGESPWADTPYFGGEKTDRGPVLSSGSNGGQVYSWLDNDPDFGTREPLKRDTVYWGLVRLAGTRNYEPSEWILSTTAERVSQDVQNAQAAADQVTEKILGWAENQKPQEGEDLELAQASAPAVKTYAQSYTVIMTERVSGSPQEEIRETLDAVWFSDIRQYPRQELLDAVLRNQLTTRYYGYYWDRDRSAAVRYDGEGLDLTAPLAVEITKKLPDNTTEKETVLVNENASAYFYVSTQGGGGNNFTEAISIGGGGGEVQGGESGGEKQYVVGGQPEKLQVKFSPASSVYEGIDWTTSDPRVVLVDKTGTIYFVGVGTAEITATTRITHKTARITITVTDPDGLQQGIGTAWETSLTLSASPENHFDFYYSEPFFSVDSDYLFYPGRLMTRGELVTVLSRFYTPREEALWTGETPFWDLTGEEEYAGAVELLCGHGIINGLPDGSFGGEQIVTRSEIAAILCRMMGLEPRQESERITFVDYGQMETDWSDGYVEALARAGVVLGTGEGYFHPERELTREETAAMLGRLLLSGVYYDPDVLTVIPDDVTEKHWAHDLILRSVNRVVARTE